MFQTEIGTRVNQRRLGQYNSILGLEATVRAQAYIGRAYVRRWTRHKQEWKRGIRTLVLFSHFNPSSVRDNFFFPFLFFFPISRRSIWRNIFLPTVDYCTSKRWVSLIRSINWKLISFVINRFLPTFFFIFAVSTFHLW